MSISTFWLLLSTLLATILVQITIPSCLGNYNSLLLYLLHCFHCTASTQRPVLYSASSALRLPWLHCHSLNTQGLSVLTYCFLTNHVLSTYSHSLFPRLQIFSFHGSLPWTSYLKLKLPASTLCPVLLLYFSPNHILPHYTQFCLSLPIS